MIFCFSLDMTVPYFHALQFYAASKYWWLTAWKVIQKSVKNLRGRNQWVTRNRDHNEADFVNDRIFLNLKCTAQFDTDEKMQYSMKSINYSTKEKTGSVTAWKILIPNFRCRVGIQNTRMSLEFVGEETVMDMTRTVTTIAVANLFWTVGCFSTGRRLAIYVLRMSTCPWPCTEPHRNYN